MAPSQSAYFLLVALPAGATLTGLRTLWLKDAVGAYAMPLLVGGLFAGLAIGVGGSLWARTRPGALRGFAVTLLGLVLTAFGMTVTWEYGIRRFRPGDVPAEQALPIAAFLTGLFAVGFVVALLWLAGVYTFEAGHRVTVWLLAPTTGSQIPFYQAICDCTWESGEFPDDERGAEDGAFVAARRHSPRVASRIQIQSW